MKPRTFIQALLLLLFLQGLPAAGPAGAQQAISDGELLVDAGPEKLREVITSYSGEKAVLINVWATWCAPCIEEFPHIVKLHRAYEDRLQVIFISADFPDARGRALEFLRKRDVDWTTYFKQGRDQAFIEALSGDWSGALPFSKIIDVNGEVVTSWEDKASYSTFEKYVKKAINP